jgi:hypothetical protein
MHALPAALASLACALAAAPALAQADGGGDDGEWSNVYRGDVTVKSRPVKGLPVREVHAEGLIKAPLVDIADTLTDISRFKNFMPHLKAARYVGEPEPDGSVYVYTEYDFPLVQKRDQVARSWIDERPAPDGGGAYRAHWEAAPDVIPTRQNVLRIRTLRGSWDVRPMPDGSGCWVVHRFIVDPGGWVPTFAADLGNRDGVAASYKAIEKEAQRRHAERTKSGQGGLPAAR